MEEVYHVSDLLPRNGACFGSDGLLRYRLYTGGSFEGTGVWDGMAQGSWNNDGITPVHFNPYVKAYDFGWVGVTTLTHTGDYSLHPSIGEKDGVYRVDTGSEGDFYLLESRVRDGFDTALPGEGLMVYHVHPRIKKGRMAIR